MRRNTHGDKKRFWHALLLFFLIAAFVVPSVHSHDLSHDDGKIHHHLTLKVAATHNHVMEHAGQWHGENLLAPDANLTGFSWHDHNNTQHFHLPENQLVRTKQGTEGTKIHKSFFSQAASSSLTAQKISCEIFSQLLPVTPPFSLEFIFVATDLPPPRA